MKCVLLSMGLLALSVTAACGGDDDDDDDVVDIDAARVVDASAVVIDAPVPDAPVPDAAAPDAAPLDAGPVVLEVGDMFTVTGNSCSLGYDHTTDILWLYRCSAADILSFATDGTPGATLTRPGESANDVDIDFAPVAFTLGKTAVPAGTLLFINGETAEAEVYIVDKTAVEAPVTFNTAYGAAHVVGGAVHAARGTMFLVQDRNGGANANEIAEVNVTTGAVLNQFNTTPEFDVNFGDMDVCQSTGHLFVVSSIESTIAEFTPDGVYLTEHPLPAGVTNASGIAFDDSTGEAWVSGFTVVYRLTGMPCGPM